jgi:molybdopterin-guanine dinucleotide biosynthesis protein A
MLLAVSDLPAISELLPRPLYGLVLAGGHSRRFGRDKSLEPFEGRSFRDRAWSLVQARTQRCWMGLRPDQVDACPYPVLPDALPGEGPLAALVNAARKPDPAPTSSRLAADWLVLACDMPQLRGQSLDRLLAQPRQNHDAVLLAHADAPYPEPLAGIWTAMGLQKLDACFQAGQRSFKGCWKGLQVLRVPPCNREELNNWNRPASGSQGHKGV